MYPGGLNNFSWKSWRCSVFMVNLLVGLLIGWLARMGDTLLGLEALSHMIIQEASAVMQTVVTQLKETLPDGA
jgi:hypothetical protein